MAQRKVGLHLHQVLFEVKDVDRSKEFYTKTLGFKLLYDYSPEYLAVQTPNKLQIGFQPSKTRDRGKNRPVGIEFQVDRVDSWYQTLRKRGVKFIEKPNDAWGEREARFLDPDGYRLAISSPVATR
ncbi:MAG TPA: VOC family protein [Candidatus Bathyarchaeia archaeon]|jgi:catechol 2,3-dioxygenase-like lactoylglutathione lyase family enzyme|nr:VOC family protein [Candidatus Bathyarchaeia archaeon]